MRALALEPEVVITTAAQAIALELRAMGAEKLFLMTGRDNTLWVALQSIGIRQILARSEASAVYMADAYARLTGRATFVYGAYGPGASNLAGSLAEPFWSSSPVIALSSTMRREHRFRNEYQELDQLQMFGPVTKWAVEASNAAQVPRLLREAARHALGATPGPVYIGIPGDVFEEELPEYIEPEPSPGPHVLPLTRPAPTDEDAERVAQALARASSPIILAGNGVHQSGAYPQLPESRALTTGRHQPNRKGSIAETTLALGTVDRYSRNFAMPRCGGGHPCDWTGLGGLVTDSYRLCRPGRRSST
jgi:acetolactate synthase-1/2/3 large subunit